MGEYLKPWRRKISLVILAIASVLMVAWIRCVSFGPIPYRIQIESQHQFIMMSLQEDLFVETGVSPTGAIIIESSGIWFNRLVIPIPFLSIVIPLILIAAWLLLSKPRNFKTPVQSSPETAS